MPEIQQKSIPNIHIFSKGRKYQEYWVTQKHSGGWIYIDAKRVKKTKKGDTYLFHLIDGKIDHFETIEADELEDWDFDDNENPEEWCDACSGLTLTPGEDDEIVF